VDVDEERYLILKMLEEGKITAEEASALIAALEEDAGAGGTDAETGPAGGRSGGSASSETGSSRWDRRDRHGRERRHHCHRGRPWFDRENFDAAMEEMRRDLERVRLGAVDIGDEVSRRVQAAMREQRSAWREGGPRPFRHFVRNFGDVFNVPFGREMFEETYEHEVAAEPEASVEIRDLSGDVRVETWAEPRVKVRAIKRVWAGTREEAKERAADYRIFAEPRGKEIRIGAELAAEAPGWLPARCTIDYDVRVPAGVSVRASVTNGDVSVTGVRGGVELRNTNGEVTAQGVSGSVILTTTNGDIDLREAEPADLSLKAINGDIRAHLLSLGSGDHRVHTAHGDVVLVVPPDMPLDLMASTMHGRLEVTLPCTIVKKSSTRIEARVGQVPPAGDAGTASTGQAPGVPGLEVRTLFGDVTLKAQKEA
jgi:hypothetical protein